MKYTFFLALIFATCFLTACKKNYILDENTIARTPLNIPKLIKIIDLDTTLPLGLDTLNKSYFTYDAQNRVTSYLTVGYDNRDTQYFQKDFYYYLGNDTLAYKSKIITNSSYSIGLRNDIDTEKEIYFKYANGKRISDSTIFIMAPTGGLTNFTTTYQYLGANNINSIKVILPASLNARDTTFTLFNMLNKNLVFAIDSLPSNIFGGVPFYSLTKKNNIASSVLNPFYYTFKQILNVNTDIFPSESYPNTDYNLMTQYSIISEGWDKSFTPNYVLTRQTKNTNNVTYKLRTDNFPISANVTNTIYDFTISGGASTDVYYIKTLFFYE